MNYISVQFGYNQSKLFNINCQINPLLDAISDGCYKEMGKFMKKREEFFNKEIASFKKKEQNLQKKLERLEPPKSLEPPKEEIKMQNPKKDAKKAGKDKAGKLDGKQVTVKKTKKQLQEEEEERKRKEAEEQERIRKEEEERKKKEEEEAARKAEEEKKAKEKKQPPAKGKKQEEEKKDEPVIETEEQKIAREKAETLVQIDDLKKHIEAYSNKLKLLQEAQIKLAEEELKPKIVDLNEKTGERKHLKASGDSYAIQLLRERKAYVLTQIKKGANEEEVVENIVIDGACIRTPEEDKLIYQQIPYNIGLQFMVYQMGGRIKRIGSISEQEGWQKPSTQKEMKILVKLILYSQFIFKLNIINTLQENEQILKYVNLEIQFQLQQL